MPNHDLNRGSNDDIVVAVAVAVLSTMVSQLLGTGRFSILGPIICIIGLVIYRWVKKPYSTTPEDQKKVLLNKVRFRVNTYLNDAKRFPFRRQFTLSAEKWNGQNAFSKLPIVLENGLIQEFDTNKSLLILGKPGLGKTLLLLELAQCLVNRGAPSAQEPVPVILSLSSWTADSTGFKQWLMHELESVYLVPQETADHWLESHSLLLLLDGLDEVAWDHRLRCVRAINEYVNRLPGVPGIVVCSRQPYYDAIGIQLELHETISLLPLNDKQIDDHLLNAGNGSESLQQVLSTNGKLRELARSPLMLNLLTLIADRIDEITRDTTLDAAADTYLRRVFNAFIRHQLTQKRDKPLAFGSSKVIACLSWLACAKTQTGFMIEQLQPSWLGRVSGKVKPLLVSYAFFSRIAGTTAVMCVGVVMMWVCQWVAWLLSGGEARAYGLIQVERDLGKWFLITTVFGGITMFAVDLYRFLMRRNDSEPALTSKPPKEIISIAFNVAICITVFMIASYLLGASRAPYGSFMYGSAFGLVLWFRGRKLAITNDIKIAQRLAWSWKGFWKGISWGVLGGILIGLIAGLLALSISGAQTGGHVAALAFIAATLLGGTINGLESSGEVEQSDAANRGVRTCAKNAVRTAVYVALPFAVVFWTYGMFATGSLRSTLQSGLFFGVVVGISVGSSYGGLDVIYHYCLRPFLWLEGFRVLAYERFLECAAALDFLRRSAGTYEFSHDLLAKHFALPPDVLEIIGNSPAGGQSLQTKSVGSRTVLHCA